MIPRPPNHNSRTTLDDIAFRARAAFQRNLLTEQQLANILTGADNLRPTAHQFSCEVIAEVLLCWMPAAAVSFIKDEEPAT